ncbi:MAG: tRNA (guanosine(37)-N1)-methyltransferase TrmD [Candidatus Hydrogenedentota bacterium]
MLGFDIIATVPEIFDGFRTASLLGKAVEKNIIALRVHDLRDFATDKHHMIDDRPYGGGPGMVLKPEPLFLAIEAVRRPDIPSRLVVTAPRGKRFTQARAGEIAAWNESSPETQLILVCGRYEGIDERVMEHFRPEEISIGDYVINGGEVACMVIVEAVARLVRGFMGNEESALDESFTRDKLEYPHYTRPAEFRGHAVPDVLVSGHHAEIEIWRRNRSGAARK